MKRKPCYLNHLTSAKLFAALVAGPCTYDDLVEVTGLSRVAVANYIKALRTEKLCYITGWKKASDGVAKTRVYAFGDKTDVKRPDRNNIERGRRYRERNREIINARARAKKQAMKYEPLRMLGASQEQRC